MTVVPLRMPRMANPPKLYSRPGDDLTWCFPLIVEALARLQAFDFLAIQFLAS